MKTEKLLLSAAFAVLLTSTTACEEWGKQDPPAANQTYPRLENVAAYDFESEDGIDPAWRLTANPGGTQPQILDDETGIKTGKVLEINSGYVTLANPLNAVECQKAVSFTFWIYQPVVVNADEEGNEVTVPQDITSPLLTFENENGTGHFSIGPNANMKYDAADGEWNENDPSQFVTGYMKDGAWHYVALVIDDKGYDLYIDGERKVSKPVLDFDTEKVVKFVNNVPTMTIGSPETNSRWLVDDLKLYRNALTEKEIKRQRLPGEASTGGGDEPGAGKTLPDPIYYNDFERGVGEATIQGAGSIMNIGGNFGNVFQNVGGEVRTNYLLLPADAMKATGETEEFTVNMWVNASNAGGSGAYMWCPIFSAYSEAPNPGNHAPLLCLQYRGVIANNMNGADNAGGNWCDYVDAQCDQGQVIVANGDNDWLKDNEWHMYTATFTKTTAAVYFDGELHNSWTIDGTSDGQRCEIFGSDLLKYICVGGNQSWWNDPDAGFMFDDIALYKNSLNADQVKVLYERKNMPYAIFTENFERGLGETTVYGGGKLNKSTSLFGTSFENVGKQVRSNFLLLPSDAMMRTGETQEMTVSIWVNSTPADDTNDYMWTPIFSAYSEAPNPGNHAPLLCLQYRGNIANNMNGADNVGGNWCDYVDAQCEQGQVRVFNGENDWLIDRQWHHYCCTLTKTTAAVYFDGELINSWKIDGTSDGQRCEIFGIPELNFICVGGNQSWWNDPDGQWWIDNVTLYNKALSADQVKYLVSQKK